MSHLPQRNLAVRAGLGLAMTSLAACLLSGCAVSPGVTPQTSSIQIPALTGRVHGGQQPVFNSNIVLYAAGTTGYGTGATSLMTQPVTTAADGSFNLSNAYLPCPSSSTLLYLTATGGDPTGLANPSTNNSAIQMVAALGPCSGLTASTFININELTTVAAAFAMGQFFTPSFGTTSTDGFGAPTTNLIGLTNAFATAHNMVSTTTGLVTPTSPASGTNYNFTITDQAKIDTIADILASCVNQSSSTSATNCSTLFTEATPTNAPRTSAPATLASDTLQAAIYLSLNPTSVNGSGSNMSGLTALAASAPPFMPSLATAPNDWTLALQYGGTGINYLSSAAVDGNGDLWFSNTNATGGVVMLNGGTGTVGGTPNVAGGVIGFYSTLGTVTANASRQVAIDLNNKAWFATYTANAADSKYYLLRAVGGSGVEATFPIPTGSTLPYALAVDSTNEVFATTSNNNVLSTAGNATTGTTMTNTVLESSSGGAASLSISPARIGFAPTNGSSTLYEFNDASLTAVAGTPLSPTGLTSAYGSLVDANGKVWIANKSGTSLVTVSGTTYTTVSSSCLNQPQFLAVDGNNNIWVTNGAATTVGGASIYTVCEFNNAGTLLSEATGFGPHNVNLGRGIAIDPSGNVWATSYTTGTSLVTQIIGAAVPVVTPISLALKNNTVGTRP